VRQVGHLPELHEDAWQKNVKSTICNFNIFLGYKCKRRA